MAMIEDRTWGSVLFNVVNHAFLVVMSVVWLYPMARVIALSLSDPTAILLGEVDWYPKRPTLKGYSYILSYRLLWRAYANTVLYAGVGTFVTLTLTSMIAYSLSIKTFVLRKFLTVYLAITMFFSGGLIPTFLLIKTLGGMDTFWVMVIPGSVAAFTVIVFRTFFQNHPESLRESAYIDGANDIAILFRIILPMSTALLATFALFTIVGHWNRWFEALIYLTDPERHPLQMILRRLVVLEDTLHHLFDAEDPRILAMMEGVIHPKNIQFAAVVIVLVPIVIMFPYAQRYFMRGLIVGSLKG
jgi:putative aldouronate transport system permease protein